MNEPMMRQEAAGLRAKDVCKIYRGGGKEVRAVDGISLEIGAGRSIAILGPSGAGKSTFLHLLGALDCPTSGEIVLDGTDIAALSDAERSRFRNARVGFVFQFYHLLNEFTAIENVMLPALIQGPGTGCQGPGIKERAQELLKTVGLAERMTHRPSELSGGEAQRVAIARALMNKPDYLFCDEPTGNLDSRNSAAIIDLLFSLKSRTNASLVIVTHDETLSKKTDQTIRIKDGKLVG